MFFFCNFFLKILQRDDDSDFDFDDYDYDSSFSDSDDDEDENMSDHDKRRYKTYVDEHGVERAAPIVLTLSDWRSVSWKVYSVKLYYFDGTNYAECTISGLTDYVY